MLFLALAPEELGLRPGDSRKQEPVCGRLCHRLLRESPGPKKAALPGELVLVREASTLFPGLSGSLLSVSQVELEDSYLASPPMLPTPRLYRVEAWSIVRGLSGEP